MVDEKSNVSAKSPKKVPNVHAKSSSNHCNIPVTFEVNSEAGDVTIFSEKSVIMTEEMKIRNDVLREDSRTEDKIKEDNEALQEDSGTEDDSASVTLAEESDDSGAGSDDSFKFRNADMEGSLFCFASKEWLLDYAKRLPEILSKIAEPHLYKNNKCKFINIEPSTHSFDPETVNLKVKGGDGKFTITMDASLFVLKSINVQVIDDKINVAAYHQMEGPFGHEAHEMQQIFPLPEAVDKETITAELTSNGTLIIEAKLKDDVKKLHIVREEK